MIEGRVAKGMTTTWKFQTFSVYSFSWRYFSQPSQIEEKLKSRLKPRPKTSKKGSQTLPKPFQNPFKTTPNRFKIDEKSKKASKTTSVEKKLSWINVRHPLGRHFGRPRPPKRGPRGSPDLQNGAQNVKKSILKNKSISRSIF